MLMSLNIHSGCSCAHWRGVVFIHICCQGAEAYIYLRVGKLPQLTFNVAVYSHLHVSLFFSIYSCTGATRPILKDVSLWSAGLPSSLSWGMLALILSLQRTHPIQLGSVMGLLCRVKICTVRLKKQLYALG